MKAGCNRGELCYPIIYETSYLCDFEVAPEEPRPFDPDAFAGYVEAVPMCTVRAWAGHGATRPAILKP